MRRRTYNKLVNYFIVLDGVGKGGYVFDYQKISIKYKGMEDELVLQFYTAVNQSTFGEMTLTVNPKIRTVRQLKEKVAKRLNYYPQCIFLFYKGETMEDKRMIEDFGFRRRDQIFIIVSAKEYKVPQNTQRLIVGGIDLTNVPELGSLLTKKKMGQQKHVGSLVPAEGEMKMQKYVKEEDLNIKYKRELQLMRGMGFDDEGQMIAALVSSKGDVQRAINAMYS